MANEIDASIRRRDDDALTLRALAGRLGYSDFHTTRKFREISGLSLRDYVRLRRLAFALIEVRDQKRRLLDIAVDYGFSSHEAFTRAFKAAYGVTPNAYRRNPVPVVLRTKISTFDRYIFGLGEIGMIKSTEEIKVYYVSMPAHKYLHIKNYESDGYFDFWQKQDKIPGQGCDTVCGLLDSITGKLDGDDGVIGEFSGQIMAHIQEADGRRPEAYGVRLPADWHGDVPAGMLLMDVPDGEYIVFEHGPFDYEEECDTVGDKLHDAMEAFSHEGTGYQADKSAKRPAYFFFDPAKFEKRVLPVVKG